MATPAISPETEKRTADFLVKDYEMKVRYLCDHFARMWNRFNYFVAIESGLAGGKFLLGDGKMSAGVAFLGMVLSFIWYVMGAEDRYLVRVYRKQVADAGALVASSLCNGEGEEYRYVGEIRESSKGIAPELSGWRLEAVSTTKLASLVPLLLTLAWTAVLIRACR
jgi:hypothetical protein